MTVETVDSTAEPVSVAEIDLARPEAAAEVARLDKPDGVYHAMDAADESQILDALQGNPSKVVVYQFSSGGKMQTGLSYAGVAEAARAMNEAGFGEIRVSGAHLPDFEEIQEPDDKGELVTYVQCTVYAEDALTGGGMYGTALQPKFLVFRDRSKPPAFDKFARAKALSKAQRNAMLPLIPVKFREVLIAQAVGDETRVKQIRLGAGAEELAEYPKALDDERALELHSLIRAAYDRLKNQNIVALLPGAFHLLLLQSQHSYVTLEALLHRLESQLEHERSKDGETDK